VLGLASRQLEAALSDAGVTKGGNRRERAAEKEEEEEGNSRMMVPLARRRAVGGRKRLHGRGTGLLQLRSLVSDLLLESFSARHKQATSRASQQALLAENLSGALEFVVATSPTSTSRRHGRQGRGRGSGNTYEFVR
jgi:hypothetical protein